MKGARLLFNEFTSGLFGEKLESAEADQTLQMHICQTHVLSF